MHASLAINYFSPAEANENIAGLCGVIKPHRIYLCGSQGSDAEIVAGEFNRYQGPLEDGRVLKGIITDCESELLILQLKPGVVKLSTDFLSELDHALQENPQTLLFYSAHAIRRGESVLPQPLIDYQEGSVRDDFDFGPLVIVAAGQIKRQYQFLLESLPPGIAGWYSMRLYSSLVSLPRRIGRSTYEVSEIAKINSEQEHFNYVDPRNAEYQKELERAFSSFAQRAGFFLPPDRLQHVEFANTGFDVAASVVIPVKNRARTIGDAVKSALSQECSFNFNVIVVDNHSTDNTTAVLSALANENQRLVHLRPGATDLEIGGCWNFAIDSKECGRFAVQLDSDDIYQDRHTLQKIIDCFCQNKVAAVVGAYTITDVNLVPLPPGLIDHREWTELNGHNNALRINGFGAPRAYYTPVLRKIRFPNISYGEDYAVMLNICRNYRIGRIYESLYLCRRWEGNTDAQPSIEKLNGFNIIKDGLRSSEIRKRRELLLQ